MFPGPWFHFFGQPINGYSFLYFIAIFPALVVMLWMARRRRLPLRFAVDSWAVCLAAAVTGGWVFYAVADYGQWFHGSAGLAERLLTGGTTSMGALAGILLAAAWLVSRHRDARGRAGDAADIFPAAFAIYDAIARLGCFSVGCCHGRPAFGMPWAVQFPAESACVFRGMPVHPAQLYMTLGELAMAGTLLALAAHPRFRGNLIWLWMTGYGLLRLIVEFFRGDGRPMLGDISLNQWICLTFVLVGTAMLVRRLSVRLVPAWILQWANPPHNPLAKKFFGFWTASLAGVASGAVAAAPDVEWAVGTAFGPSLAESPRTRADARRRVPVLPLRQLSGFLAPLFALRREGWALALAWLISFALLAYALLATVIKGFLGAWFLHPDAGWTAPWTAEGLALLAPLALLEEFIFRGLLQERWLASWLGGRAWRGLSAKNVMASALFALSHAVIIHPVAGVVAFPASLVLGRVMERSAGSLWPAVALHTLANLALGWFALLVGMNTPWHGL